MRWLAADATIRSMSEVGPETVTLRQLFTAAMSTAGLFEALRNRRASRSLSINAAIAPLSRTLSWCLLRAVTTSMACSRLRAPAAQAAAISPTLWPMVAAAVTPDSSRTRTIATCSPSNSGCE